jgi:transglutaminase-like putative cysteine protease
MLIRAGYDIAFNCPSYTSMILQLSVHPSRVSDLRSPDIVATDPHVATSFYLDQFGNRVTRVQAPPGTMTFSNRFTIHDSGLPDETPIEAPQWPVPRLPDETLMFLVSSRYCDSDNLSDLAWSKFGNIQTGYGRVRAICDYVHSHIRFDYLQARATRTASDSTRERVGVCRDFAHLAIALCRCMNIPARYCTGYLGDIGVPPDPAPMDFSAWFDAFLEGRWYTFDARHNHPRIGRVLMARGRDAADAAISTAFGVALLARFDVVTDEVAEAA